MELRPDLLAFIAIGSRAQLVDGALGMAYWAAAPWGAWMVKRVRLRPMSVFVGILGLAPSVRALGNPFELF